MDIASTFDDVSKVLPYQLAVALSEIETIVGIPHQFQEYVRDSTRLYRKKSRKEFNVPQGEESACCYAKFRGARTWKDVVNAFHSIDFSSNTPSPMELVSIQEHFEDIITEIVKELDGTDLKEHISSLAKLIILKDQSQFIVQGIRLVQCGMKPEIAAAMAGNLFKELNQI